MGGWKNVWRRRSQEADLDAELRFHVDAASQDYLAADSARRSPPPGPPGVRRPGSGEGGMPRRAAARWLDEFVRDVRLGFRGLVRERLFAASVTLILALGIGTSVAMFSVLNGIVLRPLPYARPGELAQAEHAPDAAEPVGRLIGGQLPRLAAAERVVRGHDLLPPDRASARHLCRCRRAAARAGRTGRPRVLRAPRRAAAHGPDVFARGIRPGANGSSC